MRESRRLRWILVPYLVVVTVIVGYNARAIAQQRGSALVVNVAARQRALAERYVRDVILQTQGIAADPTDDAEQLLSNADALLHGGEVTAVQGADATVVIHSADDPLVIAKLDEEQRLIGRLLDAGAILLPMTPASPGYAARLEDLRVFGGQVNTISNDAVGQITSDAEAAFARLVAIGIGLGVLGAIAAVAMGLLLRRTAATQAAQFRSLVHHATDLITVVDADGAIRYQSPSAEPILGRTPEELLGTSYLGSLDAADRAHLDGVFREVAETPDAIATAEYRVRHVDGSWRFVESIVTNRMDDPNVRGLVLNTRDVTDRRALQDELSHQAFHDSLTGLVNRAVFRDRVDHALARASRLHQQPAVLLLDLDGFKTVNDGLGHDAGDELLVAVGHRLQASGRSIDTVARIGGDEFAILLEDDAQTAGARAVAERVLAVLTTPFQVRGREVFVRASIGIAIALPGTTTDELLRNADAAMYAAKRGGKARYEFFVPVMHEEALAKFEVQGDLDRGLARSEFVLHYQPIVDLASGAVAGVEALVRWNHPTRGLLPPAGFIPIAEETGAIVPLGTWVLREACRQAAEWRRSDPTRAALWVSVNLSVRQLLEANIVTAVREALDASELDPRALMLELTEGSLMQGIAETTMKLRELKELGVRLAVDDFGTGASSLSYLRRFPIDLLKIDKSFVDELGADDPEGPLLVQAILDIARTLHVETIAEGIEEEQQLHDLREAGCRTGQGFLFARPLPPEDVGVLFDAGVDPFEGASTA
jgi:diguanylate cyclase (GGDEF)-like protein/PAS domain S-box-containing protein